MVNAKVQEHVVSDGSANLGFWFDPNFSEQLFGIVLADGGGYSSVWLTPQSWAMARARIDELVRKHVKP